MTELQRNEILTKLSFHLILCFHLFRYFSLSRPVQLCCVVKYRQIDRHHFRTFKVSRLFFSFHTGKPCLRWRFWKLYSCRILINVVESRAIFFGDQIFHSESNVLARFKTWTERKMSWAFAQSNQSNRAFSSPNLPLVPNRTSESRHLSTSVFSHVTTWTAAASGPSWLASSAFVRGPFFKCAV